MQVIFIITLFVLFLFFLSAPETVFFASKDALNLWFQTVVPSMLPFFILNHLLSAAGGVQLIGKIFEKPVRKFLRLPGEAAFILATGYSTGVPLSAALIADLRKKDRLSKDQGQRLLAFAANVSPGFLFSAVAVAMLERAEIGLFLAAVHYGSNLILTLLCTLFLREKQELALISRHSEEAPFSLMSVLTEAVERGLKTVFLIGGIILSFRILIAALEECEFISLLCGALSLSEEASALWTATFRGILEITVGTQSLCEIENIPFSLMFPLLSGVLAFGGISAFCQVASQIRDTDLTMGFYLRYKIIQGVMAFTISLLLSDHVKEYTATVAKIAHSTPVALDFSYFPLLGVVILFVMTVLIIQRLFYER